VVVAQPVLGPVRVLELGPVRVVAEPQVAAQLQAVAQLRAVAELQVAAQLRAVAEPQLVAQLRAVAELQAVVSELRVVVSELQVVVGELLAVVGELLAVVGELLAAVAELRVVLVAEACMALTWVISAADGPIARTIPIAHTILIIPIKHTIFIILIKHVIPHIILTSVTCDNLPITITVSGRPSLTLWQVKRQRSNIIISIIWHAPKTRRPSRTVCQLKHLSNRYLAIKPTGCR
jgi:hypothetical protein